ncbi:uncharacterized protein LOC142803959 isoform X1 [Rhipicephalus microplus]|uniref:uncharacterized protein LOC142803959 isoform X1 n=1 Tax=Rhipicephalus microplus TaxID=6941 RepID=UPI003F6C414F
MPSVRRTCCGHILLNTAAPGSSTCRSMCLRILDNPTPACVCCHKTRLKQCRPRRVNSRHVSARLCGGASPPKSRCRTKLNVLAGKRSSTLTRMLKQSLSVLLDVRNKGIPTFVLERLEHQLARSTHRRAPAKCHDDNWVTKKASMI